MGNMVCVGVRVTHTRTHLGCLYADAVLICFTASPEVLVLLLIQYAFLGNEDSTCTML